MRKISIGFIMAYQQKLSNFKRMKQYIWIILVAGMLMNDGLQAQEKLDLKQAIQIGMEQNYGIRLVEQDVAIAKNNRQVGNAGMLPVLNIIGSQNYSTTNSRQEFFEGRINDIDGARSDALNAGIQLNWTIFDGLAMFRRLDQLALLEEKSELELLLEVEQTINNIYTLYYTLVQLYQQRIVIEKTLAIGLERYQLAASNLETGAGSRLELLQAQVDLNADSALYVNLQDQCSQISIQLNQLMGRTPNIRFTVEDSIQFNPHLDLEILTQQMLENNTLLTLARRDEQLAQLALKELKGRQLPEIGINLGYNYTDQHSQSGFMLQNRSAGIAYGVNATMNLFNGLNTRREKQNIKIGIERNRIRTESLETELMAELLQYHNSYTNKLRLLAMERQNLFTANENLDIASERFKVGDLPGLEFREAQRNFLAAELRYNNLMLEIKILETALYQLSANLSIR